MLGVASCIIAVSLYSVYTAYTVLGAGNNPLITLRFRHPATAAQLLPVGERVAVWRSALQALDGGSAARGGVAAWTHARSAVSCHVRDLSETVAQKLQLALSDAALLDATVGTSSIAQSWRDVSNSSSGHSGLGQAEVLLASSFELASSFVRAPSLFTAGDNDEHPVISVADPVNSTANAAVGLLNAEFDGILKLRTVLAIFLTSSFTAFTLAYTCFVESKLLKRTIGAVRGRQHGEYESKRQEQTTAVDERGTTAGADLSLRAARARLARQRNGSLSSCGSALLLRQALFMQLAVTLILGVSLIVVGFVRRLEPEDTQATSVNVVYATHQMQHAAWVAARGLDSMLQGGIQGDSEALARGEASVYSAIAAYSSWQRVVFAGDDAGFMVSAAPGHTDAARYPSGTSGEELLFTDACGLSVGLLPSEREQRYLAPVNGSSTIAQTHAADCKLVLNGVLRDGWQVATRAYIGGMSDIILGANSTLGTAAAGDGNASACLSAVRAATWLRVGARLSPARDGDVMAAGVSDASAWVLGACHGSWPGGGGAAQAWVQRAAELLRLQTLHFDSLSQASAVHGIRGFLESLSRFALESMLPVGCVPLWLLLFLWLVGSPAALAKRRTVQAAELMSALLRAHEAGCALHLEQEPLSSA